MMSHLLYDHDRIPATVPIVNKTRGQMIGYVLSSVDNIFERVLAKSKLKCQADKGYSLCVSVGI